MIAYCGLDCEQCEAFVATWKNDDALRRDVADKWARLYNAAIRPEHINCTGCKSAGVKTLYCDQMCAVRKCAINRRLNTCADCADYPCATLTPILTASPPARARLDALRARS